MKIILLLSSILTLALFTPAKAANITAGPLSISYEGNNAIFTNDNFLPEEANQKELTVINNGKVSHNFAIATKNVSGELAKQIELSAVINGSTIFTDSIYSLSIRTNESTTITNLLPGEQKTIILEARIPANLPNELQKNTTTFDIVFGTEEQEPRSTLNILSLNDQFIPQPQDSITSTATSTASTSEPEVKGAQTDNGKSKGANPLLLFIPPLTLMLALPFLKSTIVRDLYLPGTGVAFSAVLGSFVAGKMPIQTFFIVLAGEIILLTVLNYLVYLRRRKQEIASSK